MISQAKKSILILTVYKVKVKPLVQLSLPKTTCQTLDWANSQMIAVGGENGELKDQVVGIIQNSFIGYIGVFDVKDALLKGHKGRTRLW